MTDAFDQIPRALRALLLALPLAAAGWLSLPAPVADAALKCGGMRATIVGPAKGGVIRATKKHQVIVARGPRNVIHTKGGNNRICGGPGNDRIHAGEGPDLIWGRGGDDVIFGGRGKDRIWGGPGDDRIFGGRGVDRIWGGGGNDVLNGGIGPDRIWGGPGDDVIRGGEGRDRIWGGGGNDWIDGGPGGDRLFGDDGDDVILGRDGADYIYGGPGNDRLYGGQVDDFIWGGPGNDVISGGHGVDHMYGGSGNDLLRGDTNGNVFDGGPGFNTASWATSTPGGWAGPTFGVKVDLPRRQATADGTDRVRNIQRVFGSSFNDELMGAGGSAVDGGLGDDKCTGFSSAANCEGQFPRPYLHVDQRDPRDPGLVLIGGAGADRWKVTGGSGGITVQHQTPLGFSEATAGPSPCSRVNGSAIRCTITPRFVVAWGGDGADTIEVGEGLPPETTVIIDGGHGDDTMIGGPTDDVLINRSGRSRMLGGRGADALMALGPGRSILRGGPGNDQLVTSTPCAGHLFDGGKGGLDIAGFARSPFAVRVQRGGYARSKRKRKGGCRPTRVLMNNPVLEGSRFADVLIGTKRADYLIGGRGADRLVGRGGTDHFNAGKGRDVCIGGRRTVSWNGCKVRRFKFR